MRLFLSFVFLITALTASRVPKSQPMNNVENATISPEDKSLKDDIHTLEIRLQAFRNRQDSWNEGYLRLGLTTIVLATILGGLSLFCQRKASNIELSSRPLAEELGRKNARLRAVLDQSAQIEVAKAQKDAFDASERAGRAEEGAGEANERALKAQSSLAEAEQHSAEANAKAEGFRLDIAKSNEAAKQAEARAAEAVLELARFKAPRTLSQEQIASIATNLRTFGTQKVDIIIIGDSPEITNITNLIGSAMQQGGWTPKFIGKAISGPNVSGVLVGIHIGVDANTIGAAEALITSLNSAGVHTGPDAPQYDDKLPMALMGKWDEKNVAPIRMYVSAKP
jgi:ABC-type multidrug transport system fused ATPase/permease subunit